LALPFAMLLIPPDTPPVRTFANFEKKLMAIS